MDLRLGNGSTLEIRPIRADDKDLLAAGFALLSDDTRQKRFLSPKPSLSSTELRYLTEVDGLAHVAFVAVERERPSHIAAVGRFVRERERPDTAEFAIVVGDAYQRQGVGSALARRLVGAARELGLRRFTARVLSDNVGAQKLIASIGEHLEYVSNGDGSRDMVVELAA
jgi:acetyltransferase